MLKLILSNNTEIEVKDGSTIFDIIAETSQYKTMWKNLTENNLKIVKLVSEHNDLIDQKENLVVDSESSFREKNNVVCHFYLREKSEVELLREQVADLTAQLNVHDGAINDLGEAVSGLAEE